MTQKDLEKKEPSQEQPQGIKPAFDKSKQVFDKEAWKPKTSLGFKVKTGEIKDISEILDRGMKIIEPEVIDCLLPDIEHNFIEIGQSKGKFGGGKRSMWRQTQKKTREGNKPKFSTMIVIGNKDGYVGVGTGKAKETMPAREKALRKAKLSLIKIRRGCGSWECSCAEPHSIPLKVKGKCGSVKITLIPASKGVGLCIQKECQKLMALAGIKDIYSKTKGQTRTRINLIEACFNALKQLSKFKIQKEYEKLIGIKDGAVKNGK